MKIRVRFLAPHHIGKFFANAYNFDLDEVTRIPDRIHLTLQRIVVVVINMRFSFFSPKNNL